MKIAIKSSIKFYTIKRYNCELILELHRIEAQQVSWYVAKKNYGDEKKKSYFLPPQSG